MVFKSRSLLPTAIMGLTLSAIWNPAMAASVALSTNTISDFSMSASTGSLAFNGFTFSSDTAATEDGGTGNASTTGDASAACIGDCGGWENEFYAHSPYSTEFSYGDALINNNDVLNGNGSASSIGELFVTDGVAHASGSNVMTSIFLDVAPSSVLDFSLLTDASMESLVSGTGISAAANMFFSVSLTDSFGVLAFLWSPDELNLGISGNNTYGYNGALSTQTGVLAGGNYTLNIKMENQVNGAAVVPVPAAIWLFGSGLIGLIGIARRKKV